jgi:hypothetical protein
MGKVFARLKHYRLFSILLSMIIGYTLGRFIPYPPFSLQILSCCFLSLSLGIFFWKKNYPKYGFVAQIEKRALEVIKLKENTPMVTLWKKPAYLKK